MKTLLTLDYEVFFGARAGTAERCVVAPTEALLGIARRRGARLVFFVDAGYVLAMRRNLASAVVRREHDAVCRQLEGAARAGHELQLHIHSHWEDARWTGAGWKMPLQRYALQSFAPAEIADIVRRYADVVREFSGGAGGFAYRAGGWVIQPFAPLKNAMLANGVTIDSTVFAGGHRGGAVQPYDFRHAPAKSRWRFSTDPLVEDPAGEFLEVPIASRAVGPLFFWRLAAAKKLGGLRHKAFGDGAAIAMDGGDLARRLLKPSVSVVSLDGYKASFLARAAREHARRGMEDFVAIGHPKALTPHSLQCLDAFLAGGVTTAGYDSYREPVLARQAA